MAKDMTDGYLLARHRLLWMGFAGTSSLLLLFFLARSLAGNTYPDGIFSDVLRGLTRLLLGVLSHVPFADALWPLIPVFPFDPPEGPEGLDLLESFFLSPMLWITASIAYVSARHAGIVKRLKRARDEAPVGRGAGNSGNQVGNVHAAGNIHIHQTVGSKSSEKPGSGVVIAAAMGAAATVICELIKAWHGGG